MSWGADIEEAASAFWDSTISTVDDIEEKVAEVSINACLAGLVTLSSAALRTVVAPAVIGGARTPGMLSLR